MNKGVFVKLRQSKNIQEKFKLLNEIIKEYINPEIVSFNAYAEEKLYRNVIRQSFTEKELKEIQGTLNYLISEKINNIDKKINNVMKDYIYNIDITDKHAKSLTNYIKDSVITDSGIVLNSIGSQTNKALSHVSFVVNNISRQDVNLLYSEIQRTGNIKENYKAFIDVFRSDYAQRYALEIEKNPVLKRMIEQKGDVFKININGKNYDLDKYLEMKAKNQSLETIRAVETIRANEESSTVFEFVRVIDAKEPREHSIYEGEYFSNDPVMIDTEYRGKIVKNGNTITDFNLDSIPPYGCGHVYIPV